MCRIVICGLALSFIIVPHAQSDDVADYNNILVRLDAKEYEEAESQFRSAIRRYPDSAKLRSLHVLMYVRLRRANQLVEAAYHADAYLEYLFEQYQESSAVSGLLASSTRRMALVFVDAGKPREGLVKLDHFIERLESLPQRADMVGLQLELCGCRAILLHKSGNSDGGAKVVNEVLERGRSEFLRSPEDVAAADLQARALQTHAFYLAHTLGEDFVRARQASFNFVIGQARKHPSSACIVRRLYEELPQMGNTLCRVAPKEAEELLIQGDAFFASLQPQDPQIQQLKESWTRLSFLLKNELRSGR